MKQLQNDMKKFLEERRWEQLRPGDISKSIAIEAAELLEHFQWHNPELRDVKSDAALVKEVESELADIFMYCFEMAALLDSDSEALVRRKLEKVKEKYPAELFQDGSVKLPGSELYWKIKKEHRRKHA